MDVLERCGRCDEPTDRRPAGYSSKSFCVICAEIATEVDAAFRGGQRTFWRFVEVDADEPTPFAVERLDASYLRADFTDRPYHRGWLKYCAFTSRNAALVYRIDRLDARERLHNDALEAARLVLHRLRTERHERLVRRERIVAQLHAEPELREACECDELPAARSNEPDAAGEAVAALLAVLRGRQGAGTSCEASRAELASELAWPVATVDVTMRKLVRAGLVLRETRPGYRSRYSILARLTSPPTDDAEWTLPDNMRLS